MFFDYELKKSLAELFGLRGFWTGRAFYKHPGASQGISFQVRLIWAAKIYYFARPLVVSVMHTEIGYKGVLIDIEGDMTLNPRVVALKNWDDPVQKALHRIDLASPIMVKASTNFIQMAVGTPQINSEFKLLMGRRDKSLVRLSRAVLKTIKHMASLDGREEWEWFFQSRSDDE
jgi:hypothetical protein